MYRAAVKNTDAIKLSRPAVGKCKPDKERAAFLTGAYKTYVTERKRKRDEVSRRIS